MSAPTLIKLLETNDSQTGELLSSFLSGRNRRTLEAYKTDLEAFACFLGEESIAKAASSLFSKPLGDANRIAISYQKHLIERGLQSATINRRLAALRSLVKLARTFGIISWSLEVQNLKVEQYRDTRGPGENAFQAMLKYVRENQSAKSVRDYAILRVLHDLALRASELTQINLEDLDLKLRAVHIWGKGKREKTLLTLPEPTLDALKDWIQIRGTETGPLFINFDRAKKGNRLTRIGLYKLIRTLGQKIGIKTRPHGLRHLSITEACKAAQANGYGLEEVLDHSRHASVSTLMIYRDRERNVQGQIATLVAKAKKIS